MRRDLCLLTLMLVCFFAFNCLGSSHAQAAVPDKIKSAITISINGQPVSSDTPPFIDSNSRTMVPLRFIAEALGAKVQWLPADKKVTVSYADQEIQLKVGSRVTMVNGKEQTIDTVPVIKDDRTMVPLRFLAETMGTQIEWLSETKAVSLKIPVQVRQGQVVIRADLVNLRSGPGTIFTRVGQADKGETFNLTGQAKEWYQINTGQNENAWVSASLVETQPDSPSRGTSDTDTRGDNNTSPSLERLTINKIETQSSTLSLTVKAAGVKAPKIFMLDNPRRLVLDFKNFILGPEDIDKIINAESGLTSRIRLGQFTPDTVRIVIDLKSACSYKVTSSSSDTFTIKIEPPTLKGKVVVIDPGHGNYKTASIIDPGATGPTTGTMERDVVLDVGMQVSEMLKAQGVSTLMTRKGNSWITLEDRAEVANRANADVFVSIHANSSERAELNGSTVYICDPSDPQLGNQQSMRQALANAIQRHLLKELGRPDLGVREANFSVLRNTTVPSALVEIAYLSHGDEEKLLNDPSFRKKAAAAITAGIVDYLLGK